MCRQRPEWRGERVAWLEALKADAPLRYVSVAAEEAGLSVGMRYATALGLVPDLLAGTCTGEELLGAEKAILRRLRHFTPNIRRGSEHLGNGLYLLDAQGLAQAFHGMTNWAQTLARDFREAGWETRLVVGFTPFACEMATYHLTPQRPIRLFRSRQEEQTQTMRTPLTFFGLSPDQVRRLQRFGVVVLEDFLALEAEEVRRRFGADLIEFYAKASEALFAEFAPLPEEEPLWAQFGCPEPLCDLAGIFEICQSLLRRLLPRLIKREEGVAVLRLWLLLEDGQRLEQRLVPSYPTADSSWVAQLLRLRLERFFQQRPLRWGQRVERIVMLVEGEPDPEKQGELFSEWSVSMSTEDQEIEVPRDREAGLWALSRVRAEYGENCLREARLLDHHLPGRNYVWSPQRESNAWFFDKSLSAKKMELSEESDVEGSPKAEDLRIRRHLSAPLPISNRDRWEEKEGPYQLDGGWWGEAYNRQYFFAREGSQTGWLYWDEDCECWFAEGWLQ